MLFRMFSVMYKRKIQLRVPPHFFDWGRRQVLNGGCASGLCLSEWPSWLAAHGMIGVLVYGSVRS
jgi:hypothetical protein